MKLMFKVPSVATFKPTINQLQGLDQLFYVVVNLAYLPPPFLPPSSLPLIPGTPPASPSVLSEHTNVSLGFLTTCLFLCLTCKTLYCLIVWFGSQSAKHVDALIAHLGVFLHLSPYITMLSLLLSLSLSLSLSSERLNHFEMAPEIGLKWP